MHPSGPCLVASAPRLRSWFHRRPPWGVHVFFSFSMNVINLRTSIYRNPLLPSFLPSFRSFFTRCAASFPPPLHHHRHRRRSTATSNISMSLLGSRTTTFLAASKASNAVPHGRTGLQVRARRVAQHAATHCLSGECVRQPARWLPS